MRPQLLLLALTAVLMGCSPKEPPSRPLSPAAGIVKYNGTPLAGATVMFTADIGSPGTGVTDKEGKFTITTGGRPGAVVAKCKVTVTKVEDGGLVSPNMTEKDLAELARSSKNYGAPTKPAVPAIYASPQTTTLEADVLEDGASNQFEFNLLD